MAAGAEQLIPTSVHHTLPESYVRNEAGRPRLDEVVPDVDIPVVDLADPDRAAVVSRIAAACRSHGFFQVLNHGLPVEVIQATMEVAQDLFRLSPEEKKARLYSDDPAKETVHNWRDYLRLHCHPLEQFLPDWPANPPPFWLPLALPRILKERKKETDDDYRLIMCLIVESTTMEQLAADFESSGINLQEHTIISITEEEDDDMVSHVIEQVVATNGLESPIISSFLVEGTADLPIPLLKLLKAVLTISILTLIFVISTALYQPAAGALFGRIKAAYYVTLGVIFLAGVAEAITAIWLSCGCDDIRNRFNSAKVLLCASVVPLIAILGIGGSRFIKA